MIDRVELRLAVQAGGIPGRQDELLLVPLSINLPDSWGQWSMPCTVHTSAGDQNLGGANVGQQYQLYQDGSGVTVEQYLADLRRAG